MRPERDDLAAAAEYICVRLHPQELRTAYVQHLRQRYAWGDVPWDGLIMVALQTLSDGITNVFWGLLIAAVYEKYKKPDANIEQLLDKQANMERLLDEQRATVAGLHELISKGPAPEQFSDPKIAAIVNAEHQEWIEKGRVGLQFHESVLLKIQDSDPAIAAMVDDALRQLEARGAKALVGDVHAAANLPAIQTEGMPPQPIDPPRRWWQLLREMKRTVQ